VIRIQLSTADIGCTTFAASPLVEITCSLFMLASGTVPAVHRPWYDEVWPDLQALDWPLLRAVVPHRHRLPTFLFPATTSLTVEEQLRDVAGTSAELVRAELKGTWAGQPMPSAARSVISDGPAGAGRIADALWDYWSIAIEPHWGQIRAALEDDLAHRRRLVAATGLSDVVAGLHDTLRVVGDSLQIDKPDSYTFRLGGAGLRFIPSVFVWPHLGFARDTPAAPTVAYGTRRLSRLWGTDSDCDEQAELAALVGSTRAAILLRLELPHSTTDLAAKMGHSPPSVSQHLAVLRRNGLLRSWRSGRVVLYQRTALGDQLIAPEPPRSADVR
jgi:DNA-binding transcriptional ArsR family regulator